MTRKRVSAYLNNKGLVVESTASKREIRAFYRKRKRVTKGIIGLVHTPELPKVMIVVDTGHEMDALREAKKAGLMTIAIGDQSSDMRFVDVFIPGNVDDELSVNFLLSQLGLVIA
jgi:ribosomal protein S2